MSTTGQYSEIKNINSPEDAVAIARKILSQLGEDSTLEMSYVKYLTGKSRKALSRRKIEGWLLCFELRVPEGACSSPDCIFIELYPELGEFNIPDIL
jgi:hypothetical protein